MSIGSGNIPRNIPAPSRHQVIKQALEPARTKERDRLRTNWILGTAIVVMSVTAPVSAQSAKAVGTPSKLDTMNITYTGCVQSVNHGGAFLLTNVDDMGAKSMHGDATKKQLDDRAMKGEAAKAMQHEQTPMAEQKMDAMPSKSFALAGADLSKHVGQKVSITGSLSDGSMGTMRQDVSTLTVKTLKVIAKSCS